MRNNIKKFILPLIIPSFLFSIVGCNTHQNTKEEEEDIIGDVFGQLADDAYFYDDPLILSSEQIGKKKSAIRFTKAINTYVEDDKTSVSYSAFYIPKGMCTDGTYLYTILNANSGSTEGSGYDVGIIVKYDTSLNIIDYTNVSFVWGNAVRLSYFNNEFYVSRTTADDYTSYKGSKVYNGKILKFDRELNLIDDNYVFEEFDLDSNEEVEHIGNYKDKTFVVIKNENNRIARTYQYDKKNGYLLDIEIDDIYQTPNGLRLNGIQVKKNYIYAIYFVNGSCELAVYTWDMERIFLQGINVKEENQFSTDYNYQGICEINGKLYYSISSWVDYIGFGLYQVKSQYYDEKDTCFTITMDTKGASETFLKQKVYYGEIAKLPSLKHTYKDPNTKRVYNFVFDKWYIDENTLFDLDTEIKQDYYIKAKWTFEDSFFDIKENADFRKKGTVGRIMSFNVLSDDYNNKPPVSDDRANAAFNTIERYLPDVVGLQEYDDEWYAQGDRLLDGYAIVNRNNNKVSGYTNYCTLAYNTSTVKLISYEQIRLTPNDNDNCRNLTKGLFEFIAGDYIGTQFIVTSNHWNLTEADRVKQAKLIANYYNTWMEESHYQIPVFMTGDWNSSDNSESYNTLLENAIDLYDTKEAEDVGLICSGYHLGNDIKVSTKERTTTNEACWLLGTVSFLPKNVKTTSSIDHIFADVFIRSLYADTVHNRESLLASDHSPIYADLMW